MSRKLILFWSFIVLTSYCFAQESISKEATTEKTTHVFCYTNPITRDTSISMRDHCIIKVGEKWYCTGTSNPVWTGHNPGVRLLVSDDLLNWKQYSWLIDASKLPPDCPYNGRFWAPEIHYINHKYYLIVNSGKITNEDPKGMKTHNIWLFSSDSVTGPYKLINGPLTPQYNNDATLFQDDDGQTYLYCSGNGLFQAKIDISTGKIIGEVQKFLDKSSPGNPGWMFGGIEAPFVTKKEGTYFMFFSTWTRGYEIGLLKSKSPLGPWELASPEPIFGTCKREYRSQMAIEGGYDTLKYNDTGDPYCEAASNVLFTGPDGKLWNSCHYLMYDKRPYPYCPNLEPWEKTTQMGIEPVTYKNGMFYIKGPTWTKQCVEY
jgi:beta-xylosidase